MARFVFQDKSIYYEEHGTGKPIVVLNGIMMSTASWAEFVEPFSANNRLILLDMLDQGRSDRIDRLSGQFIVVADRRTNDGDVGGVAAERSQQGEGHGSAGQRVIVPVDHVADVVQIPGNARQLHGMRVIVQLFQNFCR